jgi:NADH-quinone oxidoreductase subunit D
MLLKNKCLNKSKFIINFGPQHPSRSRILRLVFELKGDIVERADPPT